MARSSAAAAEAEVDDALRALETATMAWMTALMMMPMPQPTHLRPLAASAIAPAVEWRPRFWRLLVRLCTTGPLWWFMPINPAHDIVPHDHNSGAKASVLSRTLFLEGLATKLRPSVLGSSASNFCLCHIGRTDARTHDTKMSLSLLLCLLASVMMKSLLVLLLASSVSAFVVVPRKWRPLLKSAAKDWSESFVALEKYKLEFGNADAVLGNSLGRWCQTQRRLKNEGKLEPEKIQKLESLDFSWEAPSLVEDVESSWDEMLQKLKAYVAEFGDGQVPKKFKKDPLLGGWVALVRRRGQVALSEDQRLELEVAGFEWVSSRTCGSDFMNNFRELRSMQTTTDCVEPKHLQQWCDAQRKAAQKGKLSPERIDYLKGIGFRFEQEAEKITA